jgi:hypothetical protein
MTPFIIHALTAAAVLACSPAPHEQPSGPAADSPSVRSFTAASGALFVGEQTQLTAVFNGDSASIDGLGEVHSGEAVDTAVLSRTTAFVLRVRRAGQEVQAHATVQVGYRNRIRALANAPFAQTNHVAAALPGGGAIVMGGKTSETPAVPDSTLSQTFDPATEKFERGPELPLSGQAQVFTSMAEIAGGGFALAGTGPNAPVLRGAPRSAPRATLLGFPG